MAEETRPTDNEPGPGHGQLAVVIVSYNTCDLLQSCLASLERAALPEGAPSMRVVVVDNASGDGSAEMVRDKFPGVTLLASPENLGYTGGNNAALEVLGLVGPHGAARAQVRDKTPDYVLLLNPDTEVVGDALVRMVAVLRDRPGVGACGASLLYGDGRFQHGAFAFPGVAQAALDLFPLHRLPGAARLYNGRINGRFPQRLWQVAEPFPVDFVLGAALMTRRDVLQRVGGLDEGYFMYCEEMDWCLRVRQAGWRVVAVPDAQIIHHEGQSSRQVRWPMFERLWRSRLRFYTIHARHFAPGTRPAVRLLLRLAMGRGVTAAQRRLAAGTISAAEAAEEITARRNVAAL